MLQAAGVLNRRARDFFLVFYSLRSEGALTTENKLVCPPVNVTLLFRACPGLVAMRLCHAVCDFASFCSRVPAENREAHLLVQTAFAFGVLLKSPHLIELREWTTLRLRDYSRLPPECWLSDLWWLR